MKPVPEWQGVHGSPPASSRRSGYMTALVWSFTFFNSLRVLAYLPTMVSIWQTGQSDQHSLLTWLTWVGANVTMAAWLYEQNGGHLNRAVMVNVCNAAMCTATVALIAWFRV